MNKFAKATKKIAAVATVVTMASSAAFAGGVNYPTNFVKSGAFAGQVIIGASATADMAAATSVVEDLKADFSGTADKVKISYKKTGSGKSVAVDDKNSHLYTGTTLNTPATDYDKTDFPSFLADKVLSDQDNEDKDYKYEQTITLGSAAKAAFSRNIDNLDEKTDIPVPVIDLGSNELYTLDVNFKDKVTHVSKDNNDDSRGLVDSEKINMFGTEFTFDPKITDNDDLTLYASSNTVVLDSVSQSTTTVKYNNQSYDVKLLGANSGSSQVQIEVDGDTETVKQGDTATVGGLKVYVDEVFVNDLNNNDKTASARLFLGSDELVIPQGARGAWDDIEINGETVDGYQVYVTVDDNTKWDDMTDVKFRFTPSNLNDEVDYLMAGQSVQDPVFPELSVSFDGLADSLKGDNNVAFKGGSEDATLAFTNVAGDNYKLNIFTGADDIAYAQVDELTLTTVASSNTIIVDGITTTLNATTGASTTAAAAAVGAQTYPHYNVEVDDSKVIFTKKTAGAASPITDSGSGATTSVTTLFTGVAASTPNANVQLYNKQGYGNYDLAVEKLVVSENTLYKKNMFILNSYENSPEDHVTGVYQITNFEKSGSTNDYTHTVTIKNLVTGESNDYENGDEIDNTRVYVSGLSASTSPTKSTEVKLSSDKTEATAGDGTTHAKNVESDIYTKDSYKLTIDAANNIVKVTELNINNRDSIPGSSNIHIFDEVFTSQSDKVDTLVDTNSIDTANTLSDSDDNNDNKYFLTKTGTYLIQDTDSDRESAVIYTVPEENTFKVSLNAGATAESNSRTVDAADVDAAKAELEASGFTVTGTTAVPAGAPVAFDVTTADIVKATAGKPVQDAIVVGGPAINAAAKTLLGVESYDAANDAFVKKAGDAVARYFADSNSILVYGYTAADTTAVVNKLNDGTVQFK